MKEIINHSVQTQEEFDFSEAVKIAERAKSYMRMIILLRNAGAKWYSTHQDEILTFVQVLQEQQEGEEIEAPKNVQALFNALSFSRRKQAAIEKYDQYYEAWAGSTSKNVMLARLKTLDSKFAVTNDSDTDVIRICLCDALSGYSAAILKLYASTFYQA